MKPRLASMHCSLTIGELAKTSKSLLFTYLHACIHTYTHTNVHPQSAPVTLGHLYEFRKQWLVQRKAVFEN